MSWAQESHGWGYTLGYALPAPSADNQITLPDYYVAAAPRLRGKKRIALAGYRLGALLNQYFAQTPAH